MEAVNFSKSHLFISSINTDYYNFARKLSDRHTAVFAHESTTADTCDSIIMGKKRRKPLNHLSASSRLQQALRMARSSVHVQNTEARTQTRIAVLCDAIRGTKADAPRTWLAQCEQTSTLACRIRPKNHLPPVRTAGHVDAQQAQERIHSHRQFAWKKQEKRTCLDERKLA